jgi:SAM-dependent methyltransferase
MPGTKAADAHRRGFSVTSGRVAKDKKIERVLTEIGGKSLAGRSLLDIGTGSGEIAAYLSGFSHVTSIDLEDRRTVTEDFKFQLVRGEELPFPDRSFDIIISNHVIEHVLNPEKHISEMARILRQDGCLYLATPNRLWPWEVHYRLPLLHYLPQRFFHWLLRASGHYRENVYLLTLGQLRGMLAPHFTIDICSDRVCRSPEHYFLRCPRALSIALKFLPPWLYRLTAPIHPTFIAIMKKR